eukprot:jgi/Chlat1/1764/Chrsp134S02112
MPDFIAVEGCCHGELDKIYETLAHLQAKENIKVDLLISCGDFQASPSRDCLACPPKYRDLRTFHSYYSGARVAPVPTLFIGGNHEASNHLWELYHGGWAAPNIYFLGFSGVVRFGGVRIAGLSGIYNANHYHSGYYESVPYGPSTMRSIYHVREYAVRKLMSVREPIDVFLSHDWPRGIAFHGDTSDLVRRKAFLKSEIESNTLGSPASEEMLKRLKPRYWFSAHLHTKFPALVTHGYNHLESTTRFLALDKCLPHRDFLQVIDVPSAKGSLEFSYDEEWLSIVRASHNYLSLARAPVTLPAEFPGFYQHRKFVKEAMVKRGGDKVPLNFAPTAPVHDPRSNRRRGNPSALREVRNPQTEEFLNMLDLPYNLDHGARSSGGAAGAHTPSPGADFSHDDVANPEEIPLDDDDPDAVPDGEDGDNDIGNATAALDLANPEEIALDDDEE